MKYIIRLLELAIGWPLFAILVLLLTPFELIGLAGYYAFTGNDYMEDYRPLAYSIICWIGGDSFKWRKD